MKLLIITLSLSSVFAFAGEKWKQRRDMRVQMIGKRIAMLQKAQSCFQAASEREQFKECKQTLRAEREAIKEEAQALRGKFKKR